MSRSIIETCPTDILAQAVGAFGADRAQSLATVEDLLRAYPDDARLQFLRGSLLAGLERYADAQAAMRRAVDLHPDYGVARFQLGFLELTSGEVDKARETWRPLKALPEAEPLRLFVAGLESLIDDKFSKAIDFLTQGIALNHTLVPLNDDMQKIIGQINALEAPKEVAAEPPSATHLLLRQYGSKGPTKH